MCRSDRPFALSPRCPPVFDVPFLTDIDSRAAVKGSRDPLGIQSVWTRLGRHVVGNLTTVSTSVRDFTTLLIGYHFAAELADELGPGRELETFLKWEQLAGYARAGIKDGTAFRGIERVRRNLDTEKRITVSADRAHQILGNQKIYGLWGLYTVPARASGLLDGDPPRLTPPASHLVEHLYLPLLSDGGGHNARHIRDILRAKSSQLEVNGKHEKLFQAIRRVFSPNLRAAERELFREHLLHGGPTDETHGRQRQLAELLTERLALVELPWPRLLEDVSKAARSRGEGWHKLAFHLDRIAACESVLALASLVFAHLLGLDGKSVSEVATQLRAAWGEQLTAVKAEAFADLHAELAAIDRESADRWVSVARALASGEYEQLVELLVNQNGAVMASRGTSAAWVEVQQSTLQVRVRDEQGSLPKREELSHLWRFPYFLDSLRSVAAAVKE